MCIDTQSSNTYNQLIPTKIFTFLQIVLKERIFYLKYSLYFVVYIIV